jgi:excinuclease ABC subunit A
MISIRGAREHNLRAIDLDLLPGQLVVFTGVSGSGKSSLLFDTLHAEGQRRYLEALAPHLGRRFARVRPAAVDVLTGLPPTIGLEQRGAPVGSRATVGSLAELWPLVRVLLARDGVQHCPVCDTEIRVTSHDAIVGRLLAAPPGARLTIEAPVRGTPSRILDEIGRAGFSRVRLDDKVVRIEDVDAATVAKATTVRVVVDRVKVEADRRERLDDAVRTASRVGRGVIVADIDDVPTTFVDRPYCVIDDLDLPPLEPGLLSWNAAGRCPVCAGTGEVDERPCASCGGTRLSREARAVRWRGRSLPEIGALPMSQLSLFLAQQIPNAISALPVDDLLRRLGALAEVGLDLPLSRPALHTSSGERQRLRLARRVGGGLSGVLYALDEPAAGLGDDEARSVLAVLRRLRDLGSTVVAVEHHPVVIAGADRVVEFGPGPGAHGGRIVFDGPPSALRTADTHTGRALSGRLEVTSPVVKSARITLAGRRIVPQGITVITGRSGSGKSRWLATARQQWEGRFDRLAELEAGPLGGTNRSLVATYIGLWDTMRELLAATPGAKVRGFPAGTFSLNAKGGRCEACHGLGFVQIDLEILPDVDAPCEVCGGRRFAADVLEVAWKGRNAAELLAMSVAEARVLLSGVPRLEAALRVLDDVGLGYVPLGQPTHTLSGGEAQRLRLGRELVRSGRAEGALYLVDEPTLGLHPVDTVALMSVFRRLCNEGSTVVLASQDAWVLASADLVVPVDNSGDDLPTDVDNRADAGEDNPSNRSSRRRYRTGSRR